MANRFVFRGSSKSDVWRRESIWAPRLACLLRRKLRDKSISTFLPGVREMVKLAFSPLRRESLVRTSRLRDNFVDVTRRQFRARICFLPLVDGPLSGCLSGLSPSLTLNKAVGGEIPSIMTKTESIRRLLWPSARSRRFSRNCVSDRSKSRCQPLEASGTKPIGSGAIAPSVTVRRG